MNPEIKEDSHGGQIAAIIFAMLICFAISYVSSLQGKFSGAQKPIAVGNIDTPSLTKINPFALTDLQAKAAYVYDVKNDKVIFAKNSDEILPLASITKIMTAIVASDLLSPTSTVSITSSDLSQEGDSGLLLNEKWKFDRLLNFTLSASSNDGASALANASSPFFVDKMNDKSRILGLSSMRFFNPTGLDESLVKSGGYGSAKDVAKLFQFALEKYPQIFESTRSLTYATYSDDNFKHIAINTDAEVNNIPGIIGSKTGYSDLAGGNLAIVYDAGVNYPVIVVVLGSSYDGRFRDVISLMKASNQVLSVL